MFPITRSFVSAVEIRFLGSPSHFFPSIVQMTEGLLLSLEFNSGAKTRQCDMWFSSDTIENGPHKVGNINYSTLIIWPFGR